MKKIYMTMVALLCGVAAMAQTANLTVPESVTAVKGGEGEIEIGMTSDAALCAVAFHIALPQGCEIYSYYDEDEEETVFPKSDYVLSERCYKDGEKVHSAALQFTKEGLVQVAVFSNPPANFTGREGAIITLKFNVSENAQDGVITIKNAAASTKKGVSVPLADVTVPVGITTAINSINADDVNAPVYNVAGQRVSKAQKGVYIQNGKKVAVK